MLRAGLIGAGYMGKIHLGLLTQMQDIQFAGFYDSNVENSRLLNEQYNLKGFSNAEDLLQVCDAVIIVSPTPTHFQYAMQCMDLGKHIFIEKPAAANLAEANKLLDRALGYEKFVQVGMVERFNPAFVAALDQLSGMQKIHCNRLAPFTPRGAEVSVVMDVMIHDLDIVLSVMGMMPTRIKAKGQKITSTSTDIATVQLSFENGVEVNLTASRMAERKYRQTQFITDHSVFEVDFLNRTAKQISSDNGSLMETYLKGDKAHLRIAEMPVAQGNAIETELKSFMASILNNKKVVVSLEDGIRAMALAEEIEAAMNHD